MDAKIDAYIKENPKYWAYVQAMPRERLERTVVLNEVRELDRQQRIREGVLKQINRNPEMPNDSTMTDARAAANAARDKLLNTPPTPVRTSESPAPSEGKVTEDLESVDFQHEAHDVFADVVDVAPDGA